MRWPIIWLGLTQGLAEFLPISSSGHLIVLKSLLGVRAPGASLEVAMHVGTLAAVAVAYRQDLRDLLRGFNTAGGRKQAGLIAWATVPAGLAGLIAQSWIFQFFRPDAVVVGWGLTSALVWLTPSFAVGSRTIQDLTWGEAFTIGLFQGVALWPGLSRSGSTIFAGRSLGLDPEAAARFSFLLAIPAVAGAAALTLPAAVRASAFPGSWLVIGCAVAAVSGLYAIQWVRQALSSAWRWRLFGVYTAGAAIATWWLGG